eukprot:6465497-Ditylum_brightwellii.AAC.1
MKPFQQVKNGRRVLASTKLQFPGADKWQAMISQRDKFLHLEEWKGQMLYPLKRVVGQHICAYITMREAAEHVPFQLSKKST